MAIVKRGSNVVPSRRPIGNDGKTDCRNSLVRRVKRRCVSLYVSGCGMWVEPIRYEMSQSRVNAFHQQCFASDVVVRILPELSRALSIWAPELGTNAGAEE